MAAQFQHQFHDKTLLPFLAVYSSWYSSAHRTLSQKRLFTASMKRFFAESIIESMLGL
jgi:hypothetical protein